MNRKDPVLHSHVEDLLPADHPLAYEGVFCKTCVGQLHAGNNECMQTWIESGQGNYCLRCFVATPDVYALDDEMGLPA